MRVEVNGTRLWFDVDGPALVPDGASMRARPTVVLVHGGPASYDHSYFKPWFGDVARYAQVVYLDLRDHGRSDRGDPSAWSFEAAADDIPAFCDAVGITRPIVYGHSMGGVVAALYGARHPGHAAGLVLQSAMARFDLDRLVEAVRSQAGDDVADIARRAYSVDDVSAEEWARVFVTFGPNRPTREELARRRSNPALAAHGGSLLTQVDAVDVLGTTASPTLVCVGELDPITPVASARELADALPPGIARLEIVPGAGHFTWLDRPDVYWPMLEAFVLDVAAEPQAGEATNPAP